jgi:hypothetical protein
MSLDSESTKVCVVDKGVAITNCDSRSSEFAHGHLSVGGKPLRCPFGYKPNGSPVFRLDDDVRKSLHNWLSLS